MDNFLIVKINLLIVNMSDYIGGYLLIGPSQSGKSSFINIISSSRLAEVGVGNGISVTTTPQLYDIPQTILNSKIILVDLPGFYDTRLHLSEKEILKSTKIKMLECLAKGIEIKGFLIFESIASELLTLPNCFEKLSRILGVQAMNSSIVIANKNDMSPVFNEKLLSITTYCQRHNLKYVPWSNKIENITEADKMRQINGLKEAMITLNPYNSEMIGILKSEIRNIAIRLHANHPPPTQAEISYRASQLANQAPRINVQQVVYVPAKRQVTRQRAYEVPSGGFFGSLSGRTRTEYSNYTVWEDYQRADTITVQQAPPSSVFTGVATAELTRTVDSFMKEAATLRANEIRDSLTA